MADRSNGVYMAKIADQAKRYHEMVESMEKIAKMDVELTIEERNLLSAAYENVIGSRRASWKILSSIEQQEKSRGNRKNAKWILEYRQSVESDLTNICSKIIAVIEERLIPSTTVAESIVFYYKMIGDYYRYLAECLIGNHKREVADQSKMAYEMATSTAEAELPSTNPTRLRLAINFAIFYFEILNETERACDIVKAAFDEALMDMDDLDDDEAYKESLILIQQIRDKLVVWELLTS